MVTNKKNDKFVIYWLASLCASVLLILFIGGVTRLTHSGLSMVDWNPIMGIVPPLTEDDWQKTFLAYQNFPEYQLINSHINLAEFKNIFFWEYLHRLIARSLGVLFLLPWLYFILTKKITRAFAGKTFIGFALGGLQGLLGWYMVKSGLIKDPHVSHYRLAAHLLLALTIFSYYFWLILELVKTPQDATPPTHKKIKIAALILNFLVVLQITYGAFVAGLKAGFIYNTFPDMYGKLIPAAALDNFSWLNFFENPAMVQFIHRSLAWILLLFISTLFYYVYKLLKAKKLVLILSLLSIAIVLQFLLGVSTLIYVTPVYLASPHQILATIVLALSIKLTHKVLN